MPRKLSQRSLENSALFYVRRYSCTEEGLRRVLLRRIARQVRAGEADVDEEAAKGWVEAIVARFVEHGYVNDARFSKSRAESLLSRGASVRRVQEKLKPKGVSAAQVSQTIEGMGTSRADLDATAAIAFAKRRKLGPFRRAPLVDAKHRNKELMTLARAGFSFGIAKAIVDAKDQASLSNDGSMDLLHDDNS